MKTTFYPFLLFCLFLPQILQADTCTWLGGNWGWDDPTKWSCGQVPGPNDDVLIPVNGTITRNAPVTVKSLSITAGGAALIVTGDLTVSELITWEAGQIRGSGNTIANGGVLFQGSLTKTLKDRSLTLNAKSTWTDGMIILPQNLALTVSAGVTFEIMGNDILRPEVGNSGTLVNHGDILKSAGTKSTFEVVNFTNNGVVTVNAGTLEFRGCDSDGDFSISSPGILQLYQNILDLNAGASISGTGLFLMGTAGPTCNVHSAADISTPIEINAGTININQDITLPALTTGTSSAITFTGSGRLVVSGTMTWNGGKFENMPTGARFEGNIQLGGSMKTVEECRVELAGNSNWTAGQIRLKNNGKLQNLATFTDALSIGQNIQQNPVNAPGAEFINDGSYIKSTISTTQINVPFDNNGPIQVNAGVLQVEEGTSNASLTIASGATLEKVGSGSTDFSFLSGTISGAGEFKAGGGTAHMESGANLDTRLRISSGGVYIWDIPDSIGALTLNGGTLQGNAPLYIAGELLSESNNNIFTGGGVINAMGGATLSGSGTLNITDATLNLQSNTNWINGNIQLGSNGVVNNNAGNTLTINQAQNRIISGGGTGLQFINGGILKNLSAFRVTFASNVSVNNSGTIKGLGIYDFKATMQNSGIFAPGLSPGEMTLAGNIVNNSQMNFELEESGGNVDFDEMPIRGNLTLGGTLDISISGAIPDGNYTLIYCDSLAACLSGTFSQVNLPAGASLQYSADAVILQMSSLLPVELIEFKGFVEGKENILKWSTATEQNTAKFVIERSGDGQDYYPINVLKASGNSSVRLYYSFTDSAPLPTSYYRLRIVDFDGSEEFSPVVVLERKETEISFYPNPVADWLYINNPEDEVYSYDLFNSAGRQVWQGHGALKKIDMTHLSPGLYYLNILENQGKLVFSQKILKK